MSDRGKQGTKRLRLVGYCRVSTEDQAREGSSLVSQPERLRLYCELHGHDLVEVLVEEDGASAKNLKREKVQVALDMLKAKEVDGLLVPKLDRLTRSLKDWGYLAEEYFREDAKVKPARTLLSVGDHIDTSTANGRMFLALVILFAEWERETTVERTRNEMRAMRARGERVGKVTYGFDLDWNGPMQADKQGNLRLDKQGKPLPVRFVPNQTERGHIATMCEKYGQGLSYRDIARYLEELGIETKEGNSIWNPDTVRKIIQREPQWPELRQEVATERPEVERAAARRPA